MTIPAGIPVTTAAVHCEVRYDGQRDIFVYTYSLVNSKKSLGQVDGFYIDISTSSLGATLSADGLVNSATGYMGLTNARVWSKISNGTIPVGFVSQPNGWSSGPSAQLTAGWFGPLPPGQPIAPGESLGAFILASHGLAGLRSFTAQPSYDPADFLPGIDDAPGLAQQIMNLDAEIQRMINSVGVTVGPVQPPSMSDAGQLIQFLASLKSQAVAQRWLCGEKLNVELDSILNRASDDLSKGRDELARDELKSFIARLSEQRGLQSPDFFDRPGDRKGDDRPRVTSEAYYMLTADAEYILSMIPDKTRGAR